MFRGEPLSIHIILTGLLFFPVTILLGFSLSNILFTPTLVGLISAHYVSAFLGWIGLVILGAQLQFFRAISGLRRFEPERLRPLYYISSTFGVLFLLIGNLMINKWMTYFGLLLYSICLVIHSVYIIPRLKSSLFKFPLNYFVYSHVFLIVAILMMWDRVIQLSIGLANNFIIIHVLSIGWISLSLQGAATRALPMFVGKVINRPLRSWIDWHAMIAFVGSATLLSGIFSNNNIIIGAGCVLWIGSWIFTFTILFRSIKGGTEPIEYPITLKFFVPGFLFLSGGTILGIYEIFIGTALPRTVHIHLTLVAGLGLIMLGAIHRISSFQMYTAVYTGRRESGVSIRDFLRPDKFEIIPIAYIISVIALILGLLFQNLAIITSGATLTFLIVIYYTLLILQNYMHYRREVPNALPYDKKKSEV